MTIEYINWDTIPENFKFVAMDDNGHEQQFWYMFEEKPELFTGTKQNYDYRIWRTAGGECAPIFGLDLIIPSEESLLERPEAKSVKPEVNWDKIPEKFNYIARDQNGDWWGYDDEPEIYEDDIYDKYGSWGPQCAYRDEFAKIELDYDIDWKESLMKRPVIVSEDVSDWLSVCNGFDYNSMYPNGGNKNCDVNWDLIDNKFNYIAMDPDGEWWGYSEKPSRELDGWWAEGWNSHCDKIAYDYKHPNWEESLMKRPSEDNVTTITIPDSITKEIIDSNGEKWVYTYKLVSGEKVME